MAVAAVAAAAVLVAVEVVVALFDTQALPFQTMPLVVVVVVTMAPDIPNCVAMAKVG